MTLRHFKRTDRVQILTADNLTRIVAAPFAQRQMRSAKGGTAQQAKGVAPRFTTESSRAANAKRWARHPPTGRGYRLGARLVRRKPVPRQPLRDHYALNPHRGVQYSPALRCWFVTDDYGTRPIGERSALIRLGHLPRPTDTTVPETIVKILPAAKKGRRP